MRRSQGQWSGGCVTDLGRNDTFEPGGAGGVGRGRHGWTRIRDIDGAPPAVTLRAKPGQDRPEAVCLWDGSLRMR
jgi:hypothetical protein